MAVLPFGEYRPDASDLNGEHTQALLNVLPRSDGYGPMKDVSPFTEALPAPCRGLFMARKADGSIRIFAGTETRLYSLDNTSFDWEDVSKGGADYGALAIDAHWSFAQFNNVLVATQANNVMQKIDVESGTVFADLGGSPPQAAYLTTINRFLVASGIAGQPRRVQWSGLNAIETWTSGTTYSDYQDLPDGGNVRGVVGGEFGIILQDNAIRRMVFAPGSDIIFQIDRIARDAGTIAPWSVVESGGLIYFLSPKGFMKVTPDGALTPIGFERVDRTFFEGADLSATQYIIGAVDPATNVIFWTYRRDAGTDARFGKALAYNTALDRWSPLEIDGEFISGGGKPGITLEGLGTIGSVAVTGAADSGTGEIRLEVASTTGWTTGDIKDVAGVTGTTEANGTWPITVVDSTHIDLDGSAYSNAYVDGGFIAGSIDDLTVSLDDFSAATLNQLAMFDEDHRLGYFTGDNLEATLETAEQSGIKQRLFVRHLYPVTDAPTAYAATGRRENLQAAPVYTAETAINALGFCPQRVSTRHARGRLRIPAGTEWTFATGMETEHVIRGKRR